MCWSSTGGESQIGTNTTYTKHSFISNEGIKLPASSAPQRQVPYDCQIPLHAIYIVIQSAVYRTRMGGFLFVVYLLVFILKIILYTCERRLHETHCFTVYEKNVQYEDCFGGNWDMCLTLLGSSHKN